MRQCTFPHSLSPGQATYAIGRPPVDYDLFDLATSTNRCTIHYKSWSSYWCKSSTQLSLDRNQGRAYRTSVRTPSLFWGMASTFNFSQVLSPSSGVQVIFAPCSASLLSRRPPVAPLSPSRTPQERLSSYPRTSDSSTLAHNRVGEPAIYPNDNNAPRCVRLADVGVGKHLSHAWGSVPTSRAATSAPRHSTHGRPHGRGRDGPGSVACADPGELSNVGDRRAGCWIQKVAMPDPPFSHLAPPLLSATFCIVGLALYFPSSTPDLECFDRDVAASRAPAIQQYTPWDGVERILERREDHVWWAGGFLLVFHDGLGLAFDRF